VHDDEVAGEHESRPPETCRSIERVLIQVEAMARARGVFLPKMARCWILAMVRGNSAAETQPRRAIQSALVAKIAWKTFSHIQRAPVMFPGPSPCSRRWRNVIPTAAARSFSLLLSVAWRRCSRVCTGWTRWPRVRIYTPQGGGKRSRGKSPAGGFLLSGFRGHRIATNAVRAWVGYEGDDAVEAAPLGSSGRVPESPTGRAHLSAYTREA
jgi:hypothetical protein